MFLKLFSTRLKFLDFLFLLVSLLLLVSCSQHKEEILIFCSRGLKAPVEEIIKNFEKKYPIKIDVVYAGTHNCVRVIRETKKGDIFIAGCGCVVIHNPDLVKEKIFLAYHVPVLLVRKDLPFKIRAFDDLLKYDVKIGIGDPNTCAIGRVTEIILSRYSKALELRKKIIYQTSTSPELLDLLATKQIDAAIIWYDLAKNFKNAYIINIPSNINEAKKVFAILLTTNKREKPARLFLDFLVRSKNNIFPKYGFPIKNGLNI